MNGGQSFCPRKIFKKKEASVRKYCEDKSYDMFKPEVGMRFDTCEDAYKFYNMYSWVLGFSIRCGDNYTNTKKIRTNQEYTARRGLRPTRQPRLAPRRQ
jgi:hypothetical protein